MCVCERDNNSVLQCRRLVDDVSMIRFGKELYRCLYARWTWDSITQVRDELRVAELLCSWPGYSEHALWQTNILPWCGLPMAGG